MGNNPINNLDPTGHYYDPGGNYHEISDDGYKDLAGEMGIEIKDTSPWKDIVDSALDDQYNNSGGGAGGGSSSGGGGDGGSSGGVGESRPPTLEEGQQLLNQAARPVTYSANLSRSFSRGNILQKGSQGPKVALLQQTLESLGYLTMPTGVSYGYFGDLTLDAVNRYKNAHDLGNDGPYYGKVGAQTWGTLKLPVDTRELSELMWPVPGSRNVTSPFGPREGGKHKGIDIGGNPGLEIVSAVNGKVTRVASTDTSGGYGNVVYIESLHYQSIMETRYAHMLDDSIVVEVGQDVYVGQVIGKLGNTGRSYGAHLHFEVRINGEPDDPLKYL